MKQSTYVRATCGGTAFWVVLMLLVAAFHRQIFGQ